VPAARVALYAATAAVFVLAARAVLIAPPPLWLAALATLGYVALLLSGVFVLRLRMFADAVTRGPVDARGIALTFDDGPDPETTRGVLDALDAAGVKGTFFVIARKAETYPDIVRETLRRGHTVALHSYEHDRLFSLRSEKVVRADLARGIAVLEEITGERPRLFRPPIGHTNPLIARVADELDLTVVGWSVGGRDGVRAEVDAVVARVSSRLEDGAIVLLHDASERGDHRPVAARALPEIIARAREARLDVVPLAAFVRD
jgi:peptidoglycan/xylan/chitin deacetylase (PgdA/CDA1 family)